MVEEFAFDNADERRKVRQNGTGWIEVIAGSMFSGKSEELIRRLTRARIARQKVQVFKPGIDVRYSFEEIASHSGQKHMSIPVSTSAEMLSKVLPDTEVIGIDEGQFFDMPIVDAVNELAAAGKRVIIAGLDQDFMGVASQIVDYLDNGVALRVRVADQGLDLVTLIRNLLITEG